jgi:hypothetical protein
MITQAFTANSLPAAAAIRTVAVFEILFFLTFHTKKPPYFIVLYTSLPHIMHCQLLTRFAAHIQQIIHNPVKAVKIKCGQ